MHRKYGLSIPEGIYDMKDEDLDSLIKRGRSEKTYQEVTSRGLGGNRNHVRSIITNLKFNMTERQWIRTRSSYETNYIEFFEKNQIPWDYECLSIRTENSSYIPDFIFILNDERFILETKGYIPDKTQYFKDKIGPGVEYAKENGYTFLFTYEPKPKSIEHLIEQTPDRTYIWH